MAPEGFGEFFLASADAGAAFVGLLFVAISIGPQCTFGDSVVVSAPRQHLAEATFLTLANGFVVSSIALIPTINVGWVLSDWAPWGHSPQHTWVGSSPNSITTAPPHHALWQHLLRVAGLSIIAAVVYVIEGVLGLRLVLQPRDEVAFGWLAAVVVGLYVLGIVRAWTLRGDPQHSWSGWLNPLQDLVESEESDGPASKST